MRAMWRFVYDGKDGMTVLYRIPLVEGVAEDVRQTCIDEFTSVFGHAPATVEFVKVD